MSTRTATGHEREKDQAPARSPGGRADDRGQLKPATCLKPSLHRYFGNRCVQRMALTGSTAAADAAVPSIVHDVLRGPGEPLDPTTRGFMESRFDTDFGHVRVHADDRAAESAAVIDARAYTVGGDLVFGGNTYAPSTYGGRELLAHELAHTIQQREPGGAPSSTRPDGLHESAARTAGHEAASGQMVTADLAALGVGLSRAPAPERSPVLDRGKRTWRKYAAAEGRKDAARLRKRGQLSNEDRQEINSKLSFFEGAAHEIYLREVRPALLRVTGADFIEVPETPQSYVRKLPPEEAATFLRRREHTLRYFRKTKPEQLERHYTLVLQDYLAGDTRWDLDTLEEIVRERAPGASWHAKARQGFLANLQAREEARERQAVVSQSDYWKNQMGALAEQTRSWPKEAQAIAHNLLWKWFELRRTVSPSDPSRALPGIEPGIETAIRQDLVSQFEQVLRAAEKQVRAECEKNPPGWMQRMHGDPCGPWFGTVLRRGSAALANFERTLINRRDEDGVPYRTVVFWVQEYLKQQVPTSVAGRYLELLQARSMLNVALTLVVKPVNIPKPPPASLGISRGVDVTGAKAFSTTLPARAAPLPPRRAPAGVATPPRLRSAAVPPAPRPTTAPVVEARAASPPPVAAPVAASRPPLSWWQRVARDRVIAAAMRGLKEAGGAPTIGAGRGAQAAITAKAPPPSPAPTPAPMPRVQMAPQIARPINRVPSSTVRRAPMAPRLGAEASVRVTPAPRVVSPPSGRAPVTGASLATITAARGAARVVTQGTAFTHDQILDLFVRHFGRPGPPQGTIVFHASEASFQAAAQAAGLPAGTLGFFAHPTQPGAAPGTPGAMGLIHLPPSASTLVTIHEALHMMGYQSGVIAMLGQFVEEGLTEWLARSLGPQTIRGVYDANVAFVKLLAGVVGEQTLRNAYLHRQWAQLRAALRARLGGDAPVDHFYRLLRQVGPYGQRGGVLQEAIDMLWPASAEDVAPRGTTAPAAAAPSGARSAVAQQSASIAASRDRTSAQRRQARQDIEQAIAKESARLSRSGSQPLDPAAFPPIPKRPVLTGEARARARQQWEDALWPLARQQGGTIREITVEGVYFNKVEVIRNGDELLVGYFGIRRDSARGGAGAEVHLTLEQAAFSIARRIRATSVRVFARTVVNTNWLQFLLDNKYDAYVMEHEYGYEKVIAKRFVLPGYTISEDRLRQAPPPVPAKWPGVQEFGAYGIQWGHGEEAARNRLRALKQMGRRKAIRQLEEAGITLNLAERWRSHYAFEIYEAGVANATARAREELMAYAVELLSGKAARR